MSMVDLLAEPGRGAAVGDRVGFSRVEEIACLRLEIEQWLASLPDRTRFVVSGVAMGLPYRVVANAIGVSESRIAQIVAQAKARFMSR